MASSSNFEDFLPLMANKLGGDGLVGELCNGFNLLVDSEKGVITFDSLKKNSALLGLQDLSDDDLRLSPELMEESQFLLEEALLQEFKHYC
ncbi:hypothetical protein H0E87_021033 [Populus deltoides]|uniref:EF-hand domain-containing protein n=1 Tax=Populus deltoides TaxID=3696 RepID=A0A8T2XPY0_POPDE|nr:hypothetical protein H0E87_021033 [Populus deltoides]